MAVICSFLFGCSAKKESVTPQSRYHGDVNLNKPGVFPVCKEKITLTVGLAGTSVVENFETNELTKYLEKKMNAELDFVVYDTDNMDETIELMMSAGGNNLPDIIIGNNVDDSDMISYGQKGYILPLNDYYENSSYYLKKIIEKEGSKFTDMITMSDGNIYCVPKYTKILQNEYAMKLWIYKPFLDKLGLDFPKTTDDFYNVLKAIKYGDPNGNGINDELPFVGAGLSDVAPSNFTDFIMSAFVYADVEDYYMYPEDGIIRFACTDDRWKEGLKYLKKLCSEGLLLPSSFTATSEQLDNLVNKEEPVVGALVSMKPAIAEDDPKAQQYKVAEPLEGPNGEKNSIIWASKPMNRFFITKSCKYPEAAFRLGDLMCDEYVSIMNRWGIEGKDWQSATDEDVSVAADEGYPALIIPGLEWGVKQNSHWFGMGPGYRDYNIAFGIAVTASKPMDYEIARSSIVYQSYTPKEYISKLVYSIDEYDEIINIRNSIMSYVEKSTVEFITGTKDIESGWDGYVANIKAMGIEHLINVTQVAYDRIKK